MWLAGLGGWPLGLCKALPGLSLISDGGVTLWSEQPLTSSAARGSQRRPCDPGDGVFWSSWRSSLRVVGWAARNCRGQSRTTWWACRPCSVTLIMAWVHPMIMGKREDVYPLGHSAMIVGTWAHKSVRPFPLASTRQVSKILPQGCLSSISFLNRGLNFKGAHEFGWEEKLHFYFYSP